MTESECIAWVSKQIEAFSPTEDMADGDAVSRLRNLRNAKSTVGNGAVFGFSFPSEIRPQVIPRAAELIAHALQTWDRWLAINDTGSKQPPLETRPIRSAPDPSMQKAVAHLRERLRDTASATTAWLANDWLVSPNHKHGFAFAPAALTETELPNGPELPSPLLDLYSVIGGLWVGETKAPGGEQTFEADREYYVFAPFESLIDLAWTYDREDGFIVMNTDPDFFYRTLISPDGEIFAETKLDAQPRKTADSLVQYLGKLADSYGRR